MPTGQRQEVLNVLLAQLLQERGVVVAPESILYTGKDSQRQMPDVLVNYQGLRTAIEGEIDSASAQKKATKSALGRVETGVAQIGIGIVYPAELREVDFAELKTKLSTAQFQITIITEAEAQNYVTADLNYLERALRDTFEQLIKEDVVAEAVALIDAAVDRFAGAVMGFAGIWGRLVDVLAGEPLTDEENKKLKPEAIAANCRIGALILLNAMIFHDTLSRGDRQITSIKIILDKKDFDLFPADWKYILENINYYSIFHLAREIYFTLNLGAWGVSEAVEYMAKAAGQISDRRTALRHDLMGRVYHRLLADAKYLGTYYTSIPAATLLLKLALRPAGWAVNWQDIEAVGQLKIADPSCGTGTLLMASVDAVVDNYLYSVVEHRQKVDLNTLYKTLSENVIHGYDVLTSAIHLTASTLALRTPDAPVKHMNLYALPLGGLENKLGSLEFLSGNYAQMPSDLFGATDKTKQVTDKALAESQAILPLLDLCVMNPPFVRSAGGNLLFGSLPEKTRAQMQTRLSNMVRQTKAKANITAGLGSVFIVIADRNLKIGGRMALILPKALISGVAWGKSRELINERYKIDYIIVSHDAERWNFSESTDLSEMMMVATKIRENGNGNGKQKSEHQVKIINLWRNPTVSLESLIIAIQLLEDKGIPDLVTGQGTFPLMVNGQKSGEVISYPWDEMKEHWFLPCAFAQTDLARIAYRLQRGQLWLPTASKIDALPLCQLKTLGTLGYDARDVHDGFIVSDSPTLYEAFWGHASEGVTTIAQKPNKYLAPLTKAKDKRNLKNYQTLWESASNLLIVERMRLNTQKLACVRLNEPVLASSWWTIRLNKSLTESQEKALVIWLNSTLAYILLLTQRNETEGAWVKFKKPLLEDMAVLDVTQLSETQLTILADAYDQIQNEILLPLPEIATDPTRKMMDDAIVKALGLADLAVLRKLMAREPVITMKRI